jgi:OMF family outer membrane factor
MKLVNIHILLYFFFLIFLGQRSVAQTWTLQQCIDTARVFNNNLQIQRNQVLLGEEKYKEARTMRMPKINIHTDYKYFTHLPYQLLPLAALNPSASEGEFREAQFGVPHNINAHLQLALPIYNPQLKGSIEKSKMAIELNILKLEKSEDQLIYDMSGLYFNAQILHHQIAFIDTNINNAQQLLTNIQLLQNQKLATLTDVRKIELSISQLTSQKELIISKRQQVMNALKLAMGRQLDEPLEIDNDIFYQISEDYENNRTTDIKINLVQNKMLEHDIHTLKKTRTLPAVSFFATYGTTGFGYDQQPDPFLNFYPIGFLGVQVSYPIFDGQTIKSQINQKNIELKNNHLQTRILEDQYDMQVKNILLDKSTALNQIEITKEQIRLAQSVYNQTVLQQKQGMARLTDILMADNDLRNTQQAYLNAIIEYLKAELELQKITTQL